jgi:hypothetical protein
LETLFLFGVTLKPNLTIGVRVRESFEESRWTIPVEVESADEGRHRIKSRRSGGRGSGYAWGTDKSVSNMPRQ